MAKKEIKLTPQQEKELKILQEQNKMLEKTKQDLELRGLHESAERVARMQEETVQKAYVSNGNIGRALEESLKEQRMESEQQAQVTPIIPSPKINVQPSSSIDAIINASKKTNEEKTKKKAFSLSDALSDKEVEKSLEPVRKEMEARDRIASNTFNVEEAPKDNPTAYVTSQPADGGYDVIPLPSKGEGYPSKTDKLPVAFLTAMDENMLTSPNLYRDGMIIDHLVRNKVKNDDFDTTTLLKGDVDAISLYLRATAYGPDFPTLQKDPDTGQEFEFMADLTKIKAKEFNLKGDENGWFDFTTPYKKTHIKFRFLTRQDERDLISLSHLQNGGARSLMMSQAISDLKKALKTDDVLSGNDKTKVKGYLEDLDKWAKEVGKDATDPYSRLITNRMELSIMSVDGDTDRMAIHQYVERMPAGDALALRKYINENEPGMDFMIEVERPASLGGGSFKSFLEWDSYIFFNLAES